jgi:hypothetical protein
MLPADKRVIVEEAGDILPEQCAQIYISRWQEQAWEFAMVDLGGTTLIAKQTAIGEPRQAVHFVTAQLAGNWGQLMAAAELLVLAGLGHRSDIMDRLQAAGTRTTTFRKP